MKLYRNDILFSILLSVVSTTSISNLWHSLEINDAYKWIISWQTTATVNING